MNPSYRIYLDACCLNRPFDDQAQPRIALETQAVLSILSQCQPGESGHWKLITSTALDEELDQMPDLEKLNNVRTVLSIARIKVVISPFIEQRSIELQELGFSGYDATHIASAERGNADIFLTTDDRLNRRAQKNVSLIRLKISNPVQWLIELTQEEDSENG
jgi:predicted nucleic acid-binding protein